MKFEEAAIKVKNDLKVKPADEILLRLYGLYKQGTLGDCNITCPGYFLMKTEPVYKWEAWNFHKGKLKEIAQKEYVMLVKQLLVNNKTDDVKVSKK